MMMKLSERWARERAADWEVTPSKVQLQPVAKSFSQIMEEKQENAFTIFKADEDKRLVFGWASISMTVDGELLEDRQKDMIEPEDLEEAAYEYVLNFRDTGEEHRPGLRKKGKLVESCVLTLEKQRAMGIPEGTVPVGWWIGFKIEDDSAWEKVKNGTYRMFSIEGKANRVPVEKSARNFDEFPELSMWYEENLDASEADIKAAREYYSDKEAAKRNYLLSKPGGSGRYLKTEKAAPVTLSEVLAEELGSIGRFDTIVEAKGMIDRIVEKFNPYHGKDGRFTSANGSTSFTYSPGKSKAHDNAIRRERDRQANVVMGPNGKPREYGKADTSDALEEILGSAKQAPRPNSLSEYLDENGNLSPQREAVHRQIINDMLEGKIPVEGQATMTMLGGGPASGKSSVMNPDTSKDPHAVTIDPDAFKAKLPGYAEMAVKDAGAASFYHEESSMLAKQFAEIAYRENYNAIYDGTGDGSVESVQKKIAAARDHGYRVDAKYVTIDTEEAVRRNQKRYDDAVAKGETPRLPPEDRVRKTHANCTDISVECAKDFDSIEIWDNNGAKGQQKLIATGGSGKSLKVVSGQETAFENYLKKGVNGLYGFVTLPDGQVVPAGQK